MKQGLAVLLLAALVFTGAGCSLIPDGAEERIPANGAGDIKDTIEPDDPASPAGQPVPAVAYAKDGNLWLAIGYNPPAPLSVSGGGFAPQFSPDGQRVLFHRHAPPGPSGLPRFELWVIGLDGGGERRLVSPDDLPGQEGELMGSGETVLLDRLPWQTVWLPDGRTVLFTTFLSFNYGLTMFNDLWTVDVETAALTRLLPDGEGGSLMAVSPDGTAVLLADHKTVLLLDADGRNRRELLSFEFVNTASEYAYVPQPVWSPDGEYGLAAIASPEPFGESPFCTLWRLPRSGPAAVLGTLPGNHLFNTTSDRLWSPDRARLAYVDCAGDLRLANADGSGDEVYSSEVEYFWGWSPDGCHFVFAKYGGDPVMLGRPEAPDEPLAAPEEAGRVWEFRWADAVTHAFLAAYPGSGYMTPEMTLWIGELDGEYRIIDTGVDGFAVYK